MESQESWHFVKVLSVKDFTAIHWLYLQHLQGTFSFKTFFLHKPAIIVLGEHTCILLYLICLNSLHLFA